MVNNKYFNHFDFYNQKNTKNFPLLESFKTYAQNKIQNCGPACVKMILEFLGIDKYSENQLSDLLKTKPFPIGTKLIHIRDFFKSLGFEVLSNIDFKLKKNNLPFKTFESFKQFVFKNIYDQNPILIENVDYGGHYKVIIGYDKHPSNSEEDRLIFADPYDANDGKNDGYNYFPADRFFYMWFDDHCLYKNERKQPFVLIKKK